MFTLVACMSQDGTIGVNDSMPWQMPSDMKHFKMLTIGHRVVMGHQTFKGLKQPLPRRHNWVASRTKTGASGLDTDTPVIFASVDRIISEFKNSEENVFVIGGREIYEQFMPHANKMILTQLDKAFDLDEQPSLVYRHVLFPHVSGSEWTNIGECHYNAGPGDDYDYAISTLVRTAPAPAPSVE